MMSGSRSLEEKHSCSPGKEGTLSVSVDLHLEFIIVNHFEQNYSKDEKGRFVVLLPMKNDVTLLGESRSLAVYAL